eukprot:TRINITY_DN16766_c0_g1_i1.p1 TRINITY_DN16766_c0_g1~~TRINITY_DN16766_c0_g1_i1.p1  ORF type:complete len:782 (-),score=113.36 TRINITY_DN16766_c0_g1_i1:56-2401(-)
MESDVKTEDHFTATHNARFNRFLRKERQVSRIRHKKHRSDNSNISKRIHSKTNKVKSIIQRIESLSSKNTNQVKKASPSYADLKSFIDLTIGTEPERNNNGDHEQHPPAEENLVKIFNLVSDDSSSSESGSSDEDSADDEVDWLREWIGDDPLEDIPEGLSWITKSNIYETVSSTPFPFQGKKWLDVIEKMPTLQTFLVQYREKKLRMYAKRYLRLAKKKLIVSSEVAGCGAIFQSTFGQFARAIDLLSNGTVEWNDSCLTNENYIKAFIRFLIAAHSQYKIKTATLVNKMVYIVTYLKWKSTRYDTTVEQAQKIQCILRYVRDERQSFKNALDQEASNQPSADDLLKKGAFLSPEEMSDLLVKCLETVHPHMERTTEHPQYRPTIKEAETIQDAITTMCCFTIGGQRKQVIINMTIKNVYFDKTLKMYIYKLGKEKIKRQSLSTLPLPPWLGAVIHWFKKTVRPVLNPFDKVISLWISKRRRPLDSAGFAKRIRKFVASKIPGKDHITPIVFRRITATYSFSRKLKEAGNNIQDFLSNYALLVNTSPKILTKHYIRYNHIAENLSLIHETNNMWLNNSAKCFIGSMNQMFRDQQDTEFMPTIASPLKSAVREEEKRRKRNRKRTKRARSLRESDKDTDDDYSPENDLAENKRKKLISERRRRKVLLKDIRGQFIDMDDDELRAEIVIRENQIRIRNEQIAALKKRIEDMKHSNNQELPQDESKDETEDEDEEPQEDLQRQILEGLFALDKGDDCDGIALDDTDPIYIDSSDESEMEIDLR